MCATCLKISYAGSGSILLLSSLLLVAKFDENLVRVMGLNVSVVLVELPACTIHIKHATSFCLS